MVSKFRSMAAVTGAAIVGIAVGALLVRSSHGATPTAVPSDPGRAGTLTLREGKNGELILSGGAKGAAYLVLARADGEIVNGFNVLKVEAQSWCQTTRDCIDCTKAQCVLPGSWPPPVPHGAASRAHIGISLPWRMVGVVYGP